MGARPACRWPSQEKASLSSLGPGGPEVWVFSTCNFLTLLRVSFRRLKVGGGVETEAEMCAGCSRSRPGAGPGGSKDTHGQEPGAEWGFGSGGGVLCEFRSPAASLPFCLCRASIPERCPAAQVSSLPPPGPPAPPRPQGALTFRK